MSKDRIEAHNDHNVYILGAGFSAEAGLPLIGNFMHMMRETPEWLASQQARSREIEAIAHVLKFRRDAAGAAYHVPLDVDNIEELFSLASASGEDTLTRSMIHAIAATLDYARNKAPPLSHDRPFEVGINRAHAEQWKELADWVKADTLQSSSSNTFTYYECPRYQFYMALMAGYFHPGKLDRRDTLISFNYDTIVEEALRGLEIPYDYGIPTTSSTNGLSNSKSDAGTDEKCIKILKLHGSVNWSDDGDASDSVHTHPTYAELRSQNRTPLLVAPTWQKIFSGHLAAVWTEAIKALKTATRVIIIGYSIPPTDQHFKYLLASGLQDNISLRKIFFVNPALAGDSHKDIEARLFSLFRREHFERGIIELAPNTVKEFLALPPQPTSTRKPGRILIGRTINEPGISSNNAQYIGRWMEQGFWQ